MKSSNTFLLHHNCKIAFFIKITTKSFTRFQNYERPSLSKFSGPTDTKTVIKRTYPSKYLRLGNILNTFSLQFSTVVASLLKRSKFFKYLKCFKGSNVAKSLILLPLRFKCVNKGLVSSKFNPFAILKLKVLISFKMENS